jgi:hypothetical protein
MSICYNFLFSNPFNSLSRGLEPAQYYSGANFFLLLTGSFLLDDP